MTTTVTITNKGPQDIGYAVVNPLAKTPVDPVFTTLIPGASVDQYVYLYQQIVITEMQNVDPKA